MRYPVIASRRSAFVTAFETRLRSGPSFTWVANSLEISARRSVRGA
jgi:hypothetical protein